MWKEFKEFAARGNLIDLSIGVIIGGAFSKIVTSLVNDIIMPIFSLLTGNIDFSNLFISLDGKKYKTLAEAAESGAATLNYGSFITVLIDFFIIAFSIFFVIRQINRFKPKPASSEPTTKECPYCISNIPIKATRCPHCTSVLEDID
mgnify:CR=1 FL=1